MCNYCLLLRDCVLCTDSPVPHRASVFPLCLEYSYIIAANTRKGGRELVLPAALGHISLCENQFCIYDLHIDILVLKRYNLTSVVFWRLSSIQTEKILTKGQGVFFETYHFITGACGLTGRSGKFIHTPFLPKNRPHIFRRTYNEPRKQTQNL